MVAPTNDPTITHDFGRGVGFYRPRVIAATIGQSVFEYFSIRRGQWRTLRDANIRFVLWMNAVHSAPIDHD